jgi:hypothetical protein
MKIEETLQGPAREALARALRSRPAGADPLSVIDYFYLAQLPPLLFRSEIWQDLRVIFTGDDSKPKLQAAIDAIAPVRNEIAHVREVSADRLQRASVACHDVMKLLGKEGHL